SFVTGALPSHSRRPGRPVCPAPGRPDSSGARRAFPAPRGHVQAAAERGLHATLYEYILLLAGAMPRRNASYYYHRGGAVRQHVVRCADGHCRRKRRNLLCIRDLLVRRLWDRHRWLGVQLEITLPRRHSFQRANDLIRTFARAGCHSGFSLRWKFEAYHRGTVPNRSRLVYCPFRWRLDESMEMAARASNDHRVFRVHDRDFRGNKSASIRFAGSRAGVGRRLQYRIQLDEVRALFSRRIRRDDHRVGCCRDIIFWRLASPGRTRWLPWMDLRPDQYRGVFRKSLRGDFLVFVGAMDTPA